MPEPIPLFPSSRQRVTRKCRAYPNDLQQSELFRYCRGHFRMFNNLIEFRTRTESPIILCGTKPRGQTDRCTLLVGHSGKHDLRPRCERAEGLKQEQPCGLHAGHDEPCEPLDTKRKYQFLAASLPSHVVSGQRKDFSFRAKDETGRWRTYGYSSVPAKVLNHADKDIMFAASSCLTRRAEGDQTAEFPGFKGRKAGWSFKYQAGSSGNAPFQDWVQRRVPEDRHSRTADEDVEPAQEDVEREVDPCDLPKAAKVRLMQPADRAHALTGDDNWIDIVYHRPFPKGTVIDEFHWTRERATGHWYVSIIGNAPAPAVYGGGTVVVGIDRGVRLRAYCFAIDLDTDEVVIDCPIQNLNVSTRRRRRARIDAEFDRRWYTEEDRKQLSRLREAEAKKRRLQRRLARQHRANSPACYDANGVHIEDRCHWRKSRRAREAVRQLAMTERLIAKWRREYNEILSHDIVYGSESRGFPPSAYIGIEALKVKNMTKSAKGTMEDPGKNVKQKTGLNRSINKSGWSQFAAQLKHKAKCARFDGRHVEVIEIDPRNTSNQCAQCGEIDKDSRKGDRFICTSCGHRDNADRNAARVIAYRTRDELKSRPDFIARTANGQQSA